MRYDGSHYCSKHPTYKAVSPPRAFCMMCWRRWLVENPDEPVDNDTLRRVIEAVLLDRKE